MLDDLVDRVERNTPIQNARIILMLPWVMGEGETNNKVDYDLDEIESVLKYLDEAEREIDALKHD